MGDTVLQGSSILQYDTVTVSGDGVTFSSITDHNSFWDNSRSDITYNPSIKNPYLLGGIASNTIGISYLKSEFGLSTNAFAKIKNYNQDGSTDELTFTYEDVQNGLPGGATIIDSSEPGSVIRHKFTYKK